MFTILVVIVVSPAPLGPFLLGFKKVLGSEALSQQAREMLGISGFRSSYQFGGP